MFPEAYNPYVVVNMPFNVQRTGSDILVENGRLYKLKTSIKHPVVENGYVSSQRLRTLFDLDLNRAVEKIQKFYGSKGETFKLRYISEFDESNGYFVSITARDESNDIDELSIPNLIIQFHPIFKFSTNSKLGMMMTPYKNSFLPMNPDAKNDETRKNFLDLQNLLFNLKIENELIIILCMRFIIPSNLLQVRKKSDIYIFFI